MNYVLTFVFTPDFKSVWLIMKEKPEWQKGSLNGIGGKVKPGEIYINSASRELKEEAGVNIEITSENYVGNIVAPDYNVVVYGAVYDGDLFTKEEEVVIVVAISDLYKYKHIANIPMLIEACRAKLSSKDGFDSFILKYD